MTAAELTLIDDQVLVACTVDEAMQLLDGPDPIAAWFRATRNETTTTITSAEGQRIDQHRQAAHLGHRHQGRDHHRGDRTWARAPSTGTRSVSERGVSEPSPDG